MTGKIQVNPASLHAAGSRVSGLGTDLASGAGSGRRAALGAASAASHPDAQDAINAFWAHAEGALRRLADEAGAFAANLHGAADDYSGADDGSAQRLDAASARNS
jgi:Excreted virulence factor EspC, type VII ESX diderm